MLIIPHLIYCPVIKHPYTFRPPQIETICDANNSHRHLNDEEKERVISEFATTATTNFN